MSRQRLLLAAAVIAAAVLLLVGPAGYHAWRSGRSPRPPRAQPSFGPVQLAAGRPIRLGRSSAPVTVALFEDFDCPHCGDFERRLGPALADLQRSGRVAVELYPMSFVDDGSKAAANAMACASTAGFGQAYRAGLFANQGLGWDDDQLLALGRQVGRPSAGFADCVRSRRHADWVASIMAAADRQKVKETPTVFVNGIRQPDAPQWSSARLRAAVGADR